MHLFQTRPRSARLMFALSHWEEMSWMPLSLDGNAMCQTHRVETQAEGEGIDKRGYHHRRRSRKERVPGPRSRGRRAARVLQEAVTVAASGICPVGRLSSLNRLGFQPQVVANNDNYLEGGERWTPVSSAPPLALSNSFSVRTDARNSFLFLRVMRSWLFTIFSAGSHGSVLSGRYSLNLMTAPIW